MIFIFRGDEILLRAAGMDLPDPAACERAGVSEGAWQQVWLRRDPHCRAAHVDRQFQPPDGYEFRKLRALFGVIDDAQLALAGRAFQVAEWARTHRYCGACGTPTARVPAEMCMRCPQCGLSAYPRISPAMMVLIRKGDSILLARHAGSPTARHTALAGFVEAGESLEETVHREVHEEVGLKVRDLKYFGSQSWPFPHSLMVAYTAEYAGGEIQIQQEEIAEARWYGPGDPLPDIPGTFSIAGSLIRAHLP